VLAVRVNAIRPQDLHDLPVRPRPSAVSLEAHNSVVEQKRGTDGSPCGVMRGACAASETTANGKTTSETRARLGM
jgi:hypothetical protein